MQQASPGGSRDSPVSDDGVPRSGSFGRGGLNVTQRDLPSVPGIPSSDDSYTSMATKGIGLEILEQAEEPTHPPTVAELEESVTWKDLGIYFLRQVLAQIQAVVPVSLYFTVFLALVFRQPLTNVLSIIGGLLLVIIGLTFFLEGLKIFFMPLSERIGWKLPLKFPLPPVLGVLTVLGILCTYAEPALNALVPLGELVVPAEAPYLYWIMNPWRKWLVLSIGLGVGLSILMGTLRLKRNWKLNPMIYITLILSLGPAIYLQWGNPQLKKLVPLAWDIGVVATGPVTVPITLALGSGIAQGSPALAKNPLSGFGLVALASLFPIITVQGLIMILAFMKSRDDLLIEIEILLNAETTSTVSAWDQSPLQELILSLRSILPLAGLLLAILLLAVRESLPELSWYQILKADKESREDSTETKERHRMEDLESHGSNLHLEETEVSEEEVAASPSHYDDSIHTPHPLNRSSSLNRSSFLNRSTSRLKMSTNKLQKSSSNLKVSGRVARRADDDESDDDSPRRGDSPTPRGRRGADDDDESEDEGDTRDYSPPARRRAVLTDDEDDLPAEPSAEPGFFDSWRISIDGTRAHLEQHYQHHDAPQEEAEPEPRDSEDTSAEISRPSRDSLDISDSDLDSYRFSIDSGLEEEEADRTLDNFESLPVGTTRMQEIRIKFNTLVKRHSVFLLGFVSVQIGCLLFNWGIVYGLSPLSLQVGGWLPTAYMHVNGISASPKYEYAIGVLFVLFFGFILGALVTLAEPGMAVFCRQVTSLTRGEIQTTFLLATVSVGVGAGLSVGILTLVFHVPTLYIVLAGYPFAVILTMLTPDPGLSAVAWDAAGTVTGPVTTPLVLSIGLAFGLRDPLVDGFGVLTCAAIFPIISVLAAKKGLDLFSGLKERARLAPVKPGQMGVLSATLRWREDEEERKRKRRERRRRRRARRRRAKRRQERALLHGEEDAHDSDPHDSDHHDSDHHEEDEEDDDSEHSDHEDDMDLGASQDYIPRKSMDVAATEPGLERG